MYNRPISTYLLKVLVVLSKGHDIPPDAIYFSLPTRPCTLPIWKERKGGKERKGEKEGGRKGERRERKEERKGGKRQQGTEKAEGGEEGKTDFSEL